MIFLTKEELKLPVHPSSSQIVFRNKLFNRGPDFSKNARLCAIEFCQQYSKELSCLLVDNYSYLSVWLEQTTKDRVEGIQKENEQLIFTASKLSNRLNYPLKNTGSSLDKVDLNLPVTTISMGLRMPVYEWLKIVTPLLAVLLVL